MFCIGRLNPLPANARRLALMDLAVQASPSWEAQVHTERFGKAECEEQQTQ